MEMTITAGLSLPIPLIATQQPAPSPMAGHHRLPEQRIVRHLALSCPMPGSVLLYGDRTTACSNAPLGTIS